MLNGLAQLLPPEGVKILLVLFLPFPLWYASSLLWGRNLILVVAGFVTVAAFLLMSCRWPCASESSRSRPRPSS